MIENIITGIFVSIVVIFVVGWFWSEALRLPPRCHRTGIVRIYSGKGLYSAKLFVGKVFWIIPVWSVLETMCTDTYSRKYWKSKENLIKFLKQQYESSKAIDNKELIEELDLREK
jgi:hypothetical protein